MNENDIASLLHSVISQPLLFSLLIILMTFILEDLTIAATAIITAQSDMMIFMPLMALFIGIVLGDIVLYGIGKFSNHSPILKRVTDNKKLQKARIVINENLILAIFTSRFIPGMRLPTYMAIGAFNISFKKFVTTVLIAVGLWSSVVFYLFYSFENIAEEILGTFKWYGLGAAVILFLIIPQSVKLARKVGSLEKIKNSNDKITKDSN